MSPAHSTREADYICWPRSRTQVSLKVLVLWNAARRRVLTSISDVAIDNCYVSRNHFEVYSVLYDSMDCCGHGELPMVYIRDCQSLEGTFVNGCCIGSKAQGHTPGYLLSQGDVITIAPYWEFRVKLWDRPAKMHAFSELQILEMHVSGKSIITKIIRIMLKNAPSKIHSISVIAL